MQQQSCGGSGYYPLPPYQYKSNYADVTGRSGIWSQTPSSSAVPETPIYEKSCENCDCASCPESQEPQVFEESDFFYENSPSAQNQFFENVYEEAPASVPFGSNDSAPSYPTNSSFSTPTSLPFWVPLPQTVPTSATPSAPSTPTFNFLDSVSPPEASPQPVPQPSSPFNLAPNPTPQNSPSTPSLPSSPTILSNSGPSFAPWMYQAGANPNPTPTNYLGGASS